MSRPSARARRVSAVTVAAASLAVAPLAFAAHPVKNGKYQGKGDLGGGAAFYSLHVDAKGKAIDDLDIRSKCEAQPFESSPKIKIGKHGKFSFDGKVKSLTQETVKLKISGSFPKSDKVKGKFRESVGTCKDSKHKFTGKLVGTYPSG